MAHYDFEHPLATDPAREEEQGLSGTDVLDRVVTPGEMLAQYQRFVSFPG